MQSEPSRIVYIGAERVGLACLRRLHALGKNIIGVVTADDSLREKIADWTSFEGFAREAGVALVKVRSTKTAETIELVRSMRPDLICVISWSMIIAPEILEIPSKGCVGFHYSLLPKRRGGAPLNWAIIDGLTETGITLFYLEESIDGGDIIAQGSLAITEDDTVKNLLDKIVMIAPDLLAQHIHSIEAGTAARTPQDETLATYTRRRRPADGEIDWSRSNLETYNFIRALAPPYPCAFISVGDRRIVVPSANLKDGRLHIQAYVE